MVELEWKEELRHSYRTAQDLVRVGLLREEERMRYEPVLTRYKFLLPRYYARLIDRDDPRCPIRKQAIPDPMELSPFPTLKPDPLNDLEHRPSARLTHRYRNRALLHLTPSCSMYCRHCFRKTLLNEMSSEMFSGSLEDAFSYLEENREIEEVILSGGDPLMANDAMLGLALDRLAALPSLKRLRIHTRVPVTFPIRVTEGLLAAMSSTRFTPVIVTHFNHPRELTSESGEALARFRAKGFHLLNQSVLLQGVNADADCLARLSEGLFERGVLPYYLHHPDRAEGTSHFDLSKEKGLAIHRTLRGRLPGYLVPRYVLDVVGAPYKLNVESWGRETTEVE
jgi:lysine 2,3-aminomutase